MQLRSPLLNVMSLAALKAAKGLIRDFGELENLQVSKKVSPTSSARRIAAPSGRCGRS